MKKSLLLVLAIMVYGGILMAQDTTGLVAYFPFNGNADDESGHGNNGIVHGALLTTDRFGNASSAYSFNGSSDWIEVMNSASLNIHDHVPLSICAWVFISSSANQAIVSKWGPGGGADDQFLLGILDKRFFFGLSDGESFNYCNLDFTTNAWAFVVGVYDPATDLSEIFINGVCMNTRPLFYLLRNTLQYVEIGRREGVDYYNGKIDDIMIYNHALTESEILDLFNAGGWMMQAGIFSSVKDQVVCKNDSCEFGVVACGIPPIHYQWQKDSIDMAGATDSILILPHVHPADTGFYRCIASNAYGSDTSNPARLAVMFSNPKTIHGDTSVNIYRVLTYYINPEPGHTYQFFIEKGNRITGNDTSVEVHWIEKGVGSVSMVETTETGCIDDTNTLLVTIGNLGLDDPVIGDLAVYPDPFEYTVVFSYRLNSPSDVILTIFNNIGQQVAQLAGGKRQSGKQQLEWNAGNIPAGIYYYRIRAGGMVRTGRIVKISGNK